ncbi:MAG: glycosyltransferase family 2 protein, partial [Desulfovibrio sp.]|nr:glycosyltransferase family 2 protein [Desulfovibrio sp.]
ECGGFYEGFVNGFEDLDLCCQVRKRGKSVVLAPESVIYHLTSQTPGRFDHDAPNAQLLSERSRGMFTPDAHRIGLADGLSPALNAMQSFYLALPAEQEQALTAAITAHFQEGRCRQRLEAHPLWCGGYELMARHLEQAGQYEDALAWRSMQLRFFPLETCALELTRCATRLRNPEMLAYAAAVLEEVRLDAGAIPQLRARAGAVVRHARERGDTVLERLYTDWMERCAPDPAG